ncbi:hypothetical protein ERJ75_001553800 [Trypanosoma vivax]|nr:hypothetical protein ERJ75_001553800 [Trypanosoma vivax]
MPDKHANRGGLLWWAGLLTHKAQNELKSGESTAREGTGRGRVEQETNMQWNAEVERDEQVVEVFAGKITVLRQKRMRWEREGEGKENAKGKTVTPYNAAAVTSVTKLGTAVVQNARTREMAPAENGLKKHTASAIQDSG